MSETSLAEFDPKTEGDRTVMHVLYGLHTLAWFSGGVFAVIALIINYLRRSDETDTLYINHHNYMISTFWWTLLWLAMLSVLILMLLVALPSPLRLLFIFPGGAIAYGIVWLWYLYRCIRGWMRFGRNRMT